jgi:hypothetical protein
VILSRVTPSTDPLVLQVDGWSLLARHYTILFGDGGTAKSTLALYAAGRLAQQGKRVLYLDWELEATDHRLRLAQMFNPMPEFHYRHCDVPLSALVEYVRRFVDKHQIDYAICDSVAYGCDAEPETSNGARSYFGALQNIGVPGALLIAHQTKKISKADRGREKPFGSNFWHNSARLTWLVKRDSDAEADAKQTAAPNTTVMALSLGCRKSNLTARFDDVDCLVTFGDQVSVALTAVQQTTTEDAVTAQVILTGIQEGLRDSPRATRERLESLGVNTNTAKSAIDRLKKRGGVHIEEGTGILVLGPDPNAADNQASKGSKSSHGAKSKRRKGNH